MVQYITLPSFRLIGLWHSPSNKQGALSHDWAEQKYPLPLDYHLHQQLEVLEEQYHGVEIGLGQAMGSGTVSCTGSSEFIGTVSLKLPVTVT